jgi:CheY-like chemotaxis protein
MKDAGKKARILVVDDNGALVENLSEVLEAAG